MENPELEFEFFLAEQLRMTVADMRERLSSDEFVRWTRYYALKASRQRLASM